VTENNPYAPPKSAVTEASPSDQLWREGKSILVMRTGTALPHRCYKCNEPAVMPLRKRTVYWHTGWFYILVFLNLLIYLIVASIWKRTAVVELGLCQRHQKILLIKRIIFWASLPLAVLSLIVFGNKPGSEGVLPVFISFMLVWLVLLINLKLISAKHIDVDYIRLRGFGKPFLDPLVEFRLRHHTATDTLPDTPDWLQIARQEANHRQD
jgi:hypothetical protein